MLTEQDIVNRAEFRRQMIRWDLWTSAVLFVILLVALYEPVHAWLHRHVEFFAGVLTGTLLQSVGWLRDRWRWMKWFSYQ